MKNAFLISLTLGATMLAASAANADALSWDPDFNSGEWYQYGVSPDGGTATSVPGSWSHARTEQSFTAGQKVYVEVLYESGFGNAMFGFGTDEAEAGGYPGWDQYSWAYYVWGRFYHAAQVGYEGTIIAGTNSVQAGQGRVLKLALDLTGETGNAWFGVDDQWFGTDYLLQSDLAPDSGLDPLFTGLDVSATYHVMWGDGERASGAEVGVLQETLLQGAPTGFDNANDGVDPVDDGNSIPVPGTLGLTCVGLGVALAVRGSGAWKF